MFDTVGVKYANEDMPASIPRKNQGDIPVVVRLVDEEHGEHFRPAEARRWTRTHVLVAVKLDDDWRRDRLAWLRAEDVHRVLSRADLEARGRDAHPPTAGPA